MSEELSKRITVRFSTQDYQQIARNATTAGITTAEYIRRCTLRKKIEARMPSIDKEALCTLKKIGGMCKQIFRNELAPEADTHKLLSTITELTQSILTQSNVKGKTT